jgi:peptidoglycan/LPS O-acetylase OafA/YrhL
MKNITKALFDNIGKHRSALMGFAMIWVFLFHARSEKLGFMPTGLWGAICENGNLGVDIFLFLSAFGLCFSLKKNTLKQFYLNRFKRIIPTWWVVLFAVHIMGLLVGSKFPDGSFVYPHSIGDMFFWYTGLGYFFNTCFYEWYIPTLLVFYLLIPLVLLYKWSGILPHLSLSVTRIPIFLSGILFFKDLEQNKNNLFLITCLILFIFIFALSFFWKVPPVVQAAPLLPIGLGLISLFLSLKYTRFIEVFFAFVGGISLEFYLIHGYRRPQYLLSFFTKNSVLLVIGAFILSLALSYLLHLLMQKVTERIELRIDNQKLKIKNENSN